MERVVLGAAFVVVIIVIGITLAALSSFTERQSFALETRMLYLENKIVELESQIDSITFSVSKVKKIK